MGLTQGVSLVHIQCFWDNLEIHCELDQNEVVAENK